MSLGEASQRLHENVAEAGRGPFPLWPERWCVLFEARKRPLWLPSGDSRFQERCVRYFVAEPWKALYARAMLRAHALVPGAGVLPEQKLSQAMRGVLSFHAPVDEPWHGAIQFGTAGPYQKATVLLATPRGDGLALAKVAMAQSADPMIDVEAAWLRELAEMRGLDSQVPRLVTDGTTLAGRRYLVTTLAPGTRQSRVLTPGHMRFLAALGHAQLEVHKFGTSPRCDELQRGLTALAFCSEAPVRAALGKALEDCAAVLRSWTGPFVIVQGDFSPWNIRVHRGAIFVFDWEYAHASGNPLADLLNHLIMPRVVSGRGLGVHAFAAAVREAGERARHLYPEWTWRDPEVAALALAYLVEVILKYSLANRRVDRTDAVVGNYWQLMERRSAWLPI